jgi:WD40 repeat protein/tetratricopeptide (TPR) repeat protein
MKNQGFGEREFGVKPVAFSPDSKTVLTHQNKTVSLWDAATGRPIGSPIEHLGGRVWFSADGKTVGTSAGRLYDTASGKRVNAAFSLPYQAYSDAILAFSPDCKNVLTVDPSGKVLRLWNTFSGQPVGLPMVHRHRVSHSSFGPDGKTIATTTDEMSAVQLWEAQTGRPIGPASERGGTDTSETPQVSFSPDGKTVAVRCFFEDKVRLLNVGTGLPVGKPLEHETVISVTFSPDGKTILTAGNINKTARLWDAATAQPLGQPMFHEDALASATFCANGTAELTHGENGTAWLWNALAVQPMGQPLEIVHLPQSVDFSTDGKSLRTTSFDSRHSSSTRLWDPVTGAPIGDSEGKRGKGAVVPTFNPDGVTFVVASKEQAAELWNAATGLPPATPRADGAAALQPIDRQETSERDLRVAYSRDGKSFVTSAGGTMRLWDTATGQPIGQPIVYRNQMCAEFSREMKTMLTTGDDHRSRLWDTVTGRPIGPPLVHPCGGPPGRVPSAALSPGGTAIATADYNLTDLFRLGGRSANGTARLWHLPSLVDDDFARIEAWVYTVTGLEADDQGNVHALKAAGWQEQRERLRRLGGPPQSDSSWLFDPILYGVDPTARARAWVERKCWAEAEAAFSEVISARPLRSSAWIQRGRFYAMRSQPEKAAADFVQALALGDRDPSLLSDIAAHGDGLDRAFTWLTGEHTAVFNDLLFLRADHLASVGRMNEALDVLLRAGTLAWEGANLDRRRLNVAVMLATLGRSDQVRALFATYLARYIALEPNEIAWYCALVPGAAVYPANTLELAERAIKRAHEWNRASDLRTLGAVLFRVGRYEESIRRLKDAIDARAGSEEPFDWPFLAMAHHRLGQRDEARRWLDKLRDYPASAGPDKFWDEFQLRLLRNEAEAVILYDPVFPADAFAR